ncbi:hypothetical protein ARALYDRAFT_901322 [Arabidopsis lyrata subsp. lyrata]|uniref:Uncharacterized protein n=1 Tax=Arabidopsis lyrata subsp. lyrata TaxID=81972 RepID=D7LCR2_ARALL|nr:hypothetical protein ARALYDRAFT_901322 [Arabidopsis lyrata subsp. lyrata]
MDKSIPMEATPVASSIPDIVDNQTESTSTPNSIMESPLLGNGDSSKDSYNVDADPISGSNKRGSSGDINDETHKTSTESLPIMVSPLQTVSPFDDSEKDCYDGDVDPSTGSIK